MTDPRFVFEVHNGAKIDFVRDVDKDLMSYFEMVHMMKDLGYSENCNIYHKLPDCDLDGGLRDIKTDGDVVDMFAIHNDKETISIYVVNPVVEEGEGADLVNLEDDIIDCDDNESETEGDGDAISPRNSISDSDLEYFADGDELESCHISTELESETFMGHSEVVTLKEGGWNGSGNGCNFSYGEGTSHGKGKEVEFNDMDNPNNSSDEEGKIEFAEFFEDRDMERPDLELGMIFANATLFRAALRKHTIQNGTEFTFVKNDGDRVTAVCSNGCGWRVHASYFQNTKSFQIKSLVNHPCNCPRQYRLRHANSAWLARTYMDRLIDDPNWKVSALRKAAKREHMVEVSDSQAYRAKKRALEAIEGNHRRQYWRLWDYCEMIRRQNHGSIALLRVERPPLSTSPVFQRMFVVYAAQSRGFLAGCRPIIGLDGCHLKGPFGGQLLSAIGKDANEQMYPLAVAVVEAETKDSWMWFLDNLLDVIGRPEEKDWTFISDRQKGLVETFNQMLPSVDHRFCVRHMYANFKLLYKGKDLKDLLWAAARSYTVQEWDDHMQQIKAINKEAFEWLMKVPANLWSRSMFSTRPKSDMLANNISESFNQYIKGARDKPIITMMEMIRRQLMSRLEEKRSWITTCNGVICPKIQSNLEKLKEEARLWEATYAGNGIYEVRDGMMTYVSNLTRHSCSCRKWDVTGIPCSHGIAAIVKDKRQPEAFVHEFFHKESYVRSYAEIINPIPDQTQWVHTEYDAIMAPPLRRPSGRPKKLRRRAVDEPKNPNAVRRTHQSLRCSNCQEFGHNTRTCKWPITANKGRGRGKGRGTSNRGRGRGRDSSTGRGRGDTSIGRGRGNSSRGRGRGRGRGPTPSPENSRPNPTAASVIILPLTCSALSFIVPCSKS
ncbi:hypothetical protein RHMOL_Rhmol02G0079600 [Rhododendron molle]|uniref:Uncharacterized protein n=1 Tax=Rhododendron molle TaxID=49168 RepID=A0ACC0PP55_RHOML|nr:hypothetical protein RHMOL_Rhmol02G0079600 [Rhododendron molle]